MAFEDEMVDMDSSYYNSGNEAMRSQQYAQLRQSSQSDMRTTSPMKIYHLDHGASTLPPAELLARCARDFATFAYINPHSSSVIGRATESKITNVRHRLAKFFGSDLADYSVVFTGNTTKALELVANCVQLRPSCQNSSCENRSSFAHLQESHTSVLGMRQIATRKGAFVTYVAGHDLSSELISVQRTANLEIKPTNEFRAANFAGDCACTPANLLVFPAQCNFTGRKYPVRLWAAEARAVSTEHGRWLVCVDASAYAATSPLNLHDMGEPDFVAVSFYKIFGYPTGLGALLVRNTVFSQKQMVARIDRNSSIDQIQLVQEPVFCKTHYYGGGAVAVVASTENYAVLRPHVVDADDAQENFAVKNDVSAYHEAFEDGTLPFYEILSVGHALDVFADIYQGSADSADSASFMRKISKHTFVLAATTYALLKNLRHTTTDSPLVEFYCGSSDPFADVENHAGTFSFNLRDAQANYIGYSSVSHLLDSLNIIVRTGCFCNIGACQKNLRLSAEQIRANYEAGHTCGDTVDLINGRPTGAVRVSFGACSNLSDAVALVEAISTNFVFSSTSGRLTSDLCCRLRQLLDQSNEIYWMRIEKAFSEINLFLSTKAEIDYRSKDVSYAAPVESVRRRHCKLTKMYLFPVKSCRAYQIQQHWPLSNTGLLYDRRWILLQENGKPLDQRSNCALAFIQPHVNLLNKTLDFEHVLTGVHVTMPLENTEDELRTAVAENNNSKVEHRFSCVQSRVCGDRVALRVFDQSAALDKFFAHVFCGDAEAETDEIDTNNKIRLAQQSGKRKRAKDGESEVSLANQAQYLLVTKASVKALRDFVEQNTGQTFSCEDLERRFRPNLVVEDFGDCSQPFEEETWKRICIGNIWFEVTGVCTRCPSIAVDPDSGTSDSVMMQALCQLRGGKLQFGVYLKRGGECDGTHAEPCTTSELNFGQLHVGDDVQVCFA